VLNIFSMRKKRPGCDWLRRAFRVGAGPPQEHPAAASSIVEVQVLLLQCKVI
jgi:hypothetical protein